MSGEFAAEAGGKACQVEYEPDTELRDTEQVPLLEEIRADLLKLQEEGEGLPDEIVSPAGGKT